MSRTTRRLLIAGAVVVALLVALDFGARQVSQYAVSRGLESALHLGERPSVSLGGFPFLPHLISGDVPTATLSAGPTQIKGLSFDGIDVALSNVRFATGALITGKQNDIRIASGHGTARVTGAVIPATVLGQRVIIRVRFEDGVARVTSDQVPFALRVRPSIHEGKLILRPESEGVPLSVSYDLPKVVPGIRYTGIRVTGSVATLTFDLRDADVPCCD